jgi:preprotein translocase subunit SecE
MKKEQVKRKKKGNRAKQQSSKAAKIVATARDKSTKDNNSIDRKSSQVPVKKESRKRRGETGSFIKTFQAIGQFFREARIELKKVKWPTRKELMAATIMVIILVIVVSLYLGVLDYGLIKLIKNLVG